MKKDNLLYLIFNFPCRLATLCSLTLISGLSPPPNRRICGSLSHLHKYQKVPSPQTFGFLGKERKKTRFIFLYLLQPLINIFLSKFPLISNFYSRDFSFPKQNFPLKYFRILYNKGS